jgi:hypothetical protein
MKINWFFSVKVFIVDFTKYCPTMDIKYYKTMVTDIPITNC